MVMMKPHGPEIHKATKTWGTVSWNIQLTSTGHCRTMLSGLLRVEIFEKDCCLWFMTFSLQNIFTQRKKMTQVYQYILKFTFDKKNKIGS